MKRVAVVLSLLLLTGSLVMISSPAEAQRTWTVLGGPWGPKDFSVVSNAFHPRAIEVAVGDTVRWSIRGFHTVTFLSGAEPLNLEVREGDKTYLNPQVAFPAGGPRYDGTGLRSSGIPAEFPKPFNYSVTFTKAGTYQYYCAIHGPAMAGTVTVKGRSTGSTSAVRRQGERDLAATMRAGRAAYASFRPTRENGRVVVSLIGDSKAGFSIFRFTRQPIVISAGESVTWRIRDPFEIHTVTFLGGEKRPDFVVVEPQKQGPPKLLLNPKVGAPTATKTYDGMGFVNSGVLYPPGIPGNPPNSFTLTFTKPGRYEYICAIHMPVEGMRGTIIVK